MSRISPIFAIDGYKLGHRVQYPEGTEQVYSNFTPRSNKHFKTPVFKDPQLVWAGAQTFVLEWLVHEFKVGFFGEDKDYIVPVFKAFVDGYLGKDVVSVDMIEDLHDLGYLPLRIKSIPEGHLVDMKVPTLTITNTIKKFFWLVNYLETLMSAELWPVATAATIAYNYRVLCEIGAERTCDNDEHIQWQCHDFAARGNMGIVANSLTGLGHLFSFSGTDSVYALARLQNDYPNGWGGSVPATEHSVMCMGEMDNEIGTFERLISEVYPSGIVSIVSDTWDYWQVITKFAPELSDVINEREGKVVFRPDTGNPADIICGTVSKFGEGKSPEEKGTIECLWETFGGSVNSKGFKVLNPKVGLIYGDSITLDVCKDIFERLEAKGFATSNIVLGVGSFTYQFVTRDTFGFAMKATYGVVNDKGRAIQKDPKTGDGLKKSLKGLIHHEYNNGVWTAKDEQTPEGEAATGLPTIFEDGKVLNTVDALLIRTRISKQAKAAAAVIAKTGYGQ